MRLATPAGSELWLAYCMNVHPGGTLATTEAAIEDTVLPLRERLGVRGPFDLLPKRGRPVAKNSQFDPFGQAIEVWRV